LYQGDEKKTHAQKKNKYRWITTYLNKRGEQNGEGDFRLKMAKNHPIRRKNERREKLRESERWLTLKAVLNEIIVLSSKIFIALDHDVISSP